MKKLLLLFAALLIAGCGEKSSSEGSDSPGESSTLSGDEDVSKKASELSDLRTKAEQGDAEAQYNLGFMYRFGDGVPEDHKEAVKSFRKAAEQGHAGAQFILGHMYEKGKGVPEDHKEAAKLYRKAAEQGHAGAQLNLGVMYDNGRGVPEDSVTAYAWWNIAAANGSELAKSNKPKLAKAMTPEQIAKAQELSSDMVKKNAKLLN